MYHEILADIKGYAYFVKSGETSVGELKHNIACHPHFHRSREFLFCIKGGIEAIVGGENITVREGDIVYVDEFEVHSYSNCDDAEAYMLVLGTSFFDVFDKKFSKKRFPRLMRNSNQNKKIFVMIEEWKKTFRKEKYVEDFYPIFVNSNRLFMSLMDEYGIEERTLTLNKVNIIDVLKYIDEHSSEDINAETIAKQFGITKEYFSKIINFYLGENFRTYLNNLRLNKFLELREKVGKEETVVKLAMDVGFNSEATFYRVYRNYLNDNKKI